MNDKMMLCKCVGEMRILKHIVADPGIRYIIVIIIEPEGYTEFRYNNTRVTKYIETAMIHSAVYQLRQML